MDFDFAVIPQYAPLIARSSKLTLQLFASSLVIGTTGGLILALMRLSSIRVVKFFSASYVWLLRGVPPLIILFFAFYALPQFGLTLTALSAGTVGLGAVASAYKAEIIRAGIMSVDLGQREAAEALAMSKPHYMRRIILPQAIRIMIPPYMSNTITLLKATSLASVITITEITGISNRLISSTFKAFEILTIAAVIYLVLNSVLVGIQFFLERVFALKS